MSEPDKSEPGEPEREWPVIIKLRTPVEFGKDRMVEALTFRRGRLGDLKGIKVGAEVSADALLQVASRMCGTPVPVLEKLDQDDAGEVMKLAIDFFGKCLTAGSAASAT